MNTQSMTIGKRMIIKSFALVLLAMVLAVVSFVNFSSVASGMHTLSVDTFPGYKYSTKMTMAVLRLNRDQLRHALSSDAEDMKTLEGQMAEEHENFNKAAAGYESTITDENVDRQNFNKLKPILAAADSAWEKVLPLSRAAKTEEAATLYFATVRPQYNALQDQLQTMEDWNNKAIDGTISSTTETANTARTLSVVMGFVVLALGIGASWYTIATVNKQLNQAVTELSEGADQVTSAATQVSASSQSLARDTSEQAAMIEETSASAEEINVMAKRNTDSARSATALVVEAVASTEQTNRAVAECVVAMDAIGESSSKIAKTLEVIDKIAFQTNILALNAAVEAARAGEAGMGFAVVAEEVRNLAQRCASASEEISSLIGQSLGNSDTGRAKMATLVESGEKVNKVFANMKTLVEGISVSSDEQGRGIDQIGRAIQKMEQGTQKSAANAEESAAAAEELNAQSQALRDVAGVLRDLVGGSNGAYASSSIAPKSYQRPKSSGFSVAPQFKAATARTTPRLAVATPSNSYTVGDSDSSFVEF